MILQFTRQLGVIYSVILLGLAVSLQVAVTLQADDQPEEALETIHLATVEGVKPLKKLDLDIQLVLHEDASIYKILVTGSLPKLARLWFSTPIEVKVEDIDGFYLKGLGVKVIAVSAPDFSAVEGGQLVITHAYKISSPGKKKKLTLFIIPNPDLESDQKWIITGGDGTPFNEVKITVRTILKLIITSVKKIHFNAKEENTKEEQ